MSANLDTTSAVCFLLNDAAPTTVHRRHCAARIPFRVKLKAGRKYAWCACGHSKKQPFCDGAHRAKAPKIEPMFFTAEKDRTVFLCACKQTKNGPYCDEPVIPCKKPFKVDVVGGKRYSWCTCGYSKKQPFCDGAHKLKAPSFTPLRFFPDKDMTIYLCGCKYTNNPPYCDGTHKQDFILSAPLYEEKDS
ncbi:hypothetical protein WMY93_007129 [Mugilogobius chulae]|uniref:Iron-binding zinc finger CDGSH type domain-containing protein n=1 Tax=Mugilogobius chulae TaxID=88201 RepID=A0AAW0PQ80_9GOBI